MSSSTTDTVADVRDWLIERVAFYLQLEPTTIRPEVPLVEYGLDSVYGLSIVTDLEDHLDLDLDPSIAWDYRTIEALAVHLGDVVAAR